MFSLVNLKYHEMVTVLQIFCDLLVPGVYVIFAFTGHGCVHQNVNYFIPVDAHGSNPRQCISSVTVSNNLQQQLCRVFKFLDCCRVKRCSHRLVLSIFFLCQFYVTDHACMSTYIHYSTEKFSYDPNNDQKYNFANTFEICSWWVNPDPHGNVNRIHDNFYVVDLIHILFLCIHSPIVLLVRRRMRISLNHAPVSTGLWLQL